jgi:two-component system, OmpR family, copper resistance phosphate regulon response regulator CusR
MRVFVVEDEAPQQEALGIVLMTTGYAVVLARDVAEAFILMDDRFDAVILDVRLPDPEGLNRDGFAVLSALRTRYPNLPVALFTGVPLSDEQLKIAHEHDATVFHKPQTFDGILDFLSSVRAKTATPFAS